MPSVATQTASQWLYDEGGGAPSCWAHVVPGSPREPVSLIASWGADLVLSELMRPSWFGRPVRRSLVGRPKTPVMIFAHRGAQTDGGQIFSEIRAPTSAAAPGAPQHREENDSADGESPKDASSGAASGAERVLPPSTWLGFLTVPLLLIGLGPVQHRQSMACTECRVLPASYTCMGCHGEFCDLCREELSCMVCDAYSCCTLCSNFGCLR